VGIVDRGVLSVLWVEKWNLHINIGTTDFDFKKGY